VNGYGVVWNAYDNFVYCIGKGPSATTVTATPGVGNALTIRGQITDQSPGALAVSTKLGYGSNGVPCISDADQEAFMEYLYEQQVMPTNATGVPVSIYAIDPNGNYIHLGDVTSDVNGFYSLGVNADTLSAGSGLYKIIARFAGSNSYGASNAECAIQIAPEPTTAPTAAPISLTSTQSEILDIGIAIVVVIIVIGVILAALTLRKRP
jgi:hypothetical protein